jgi:hypothetical protein
MYQLVDRVVSAGSAACCIRVTAHWHLFKFLIPGACKYRFSKRIDAIEPGVTHVSRSNYPVRIALGSDEEDCLANRTSPPGPRLEGTTPVNAAVGMNCSVLAYAGSQISNNFQLR